MMKCKKLLFTSTLLSALLTACGGGGGSKQDKPSPPPTAPQLIVVPHQPATPVPARPVPPPPPTSVKTDEKVITIYQPTYDDYNHKDKLDFKEKKTVSLKGKDPLYDNKDDKSASNYYFMPLDGDFENGHIGFVRHPDIYKRTLEPKLETQVNENKVIDRNDLNGLTAKFFEYDGFLWKEKPAHHQAQGQTSNGNTNIVHVGSIELNFTNGNVTDSKVYKGSHDNVLFEITGTVNNIIFESKAGAVGIQLGDRATADISFIGENKTPSAVIGEVKHASSWEAVFQAKTHDGHK